MHLSFHFPHTVFTWSCQLVWIGLVKFSQFIFELLRLCICICICLNTNMKDTAGISAIKQLGWNGAAWETAFGESGAGFCTDSNLHCRGWQRKEPGVAIWGGCDVARQHPIWSWNRNLRRSQSLLCWALISIKAGCAHWIGTGRWHKSKFDPFWNWNESYYFIKVKTGSTIGREFKPTPDERI